MFKSIADSVFSFDIEWIPDPLSGEILHGIKSNGMHGAEDSFRALWKDSGATEEKPRPYVKTALCRIVSLCGILREKVGNEISLKLVSLPSDCSDNKKWTEKHILECFLKAVGSKKPQLVGYNSHHADIPIVIQRAIVNGLGGHGFTNRPDKPWEGPDYFAAFSDYNIDLGVILGKGYSMPRLHEIATLSGIPGKVDVSGDNVWELWLSNKLQSIVNYNEFDAFTTHLLWARMAHFGGHLDDKEYRFEQDRVRALLLREAEGGKEHLFKYLKEWDRLQSIIAQRNHEEKQ